MNITEGNSTSTCCVQQNRRNNQNIQVYVRVRPLNDRDRSHRSHEVVDCVSPREVVTKSAPESKLTKKFTFDRTFGQNSRQVDIYTTVVAPYIEEVLGGYNCTVFAYGQTGTGKTHTMIGTESPQLKSSWEDDSPIGIIPRALSHLFDELRLMDVEFSMRVSYLELYNEELIDLLSADDSVKIRIFDDNTKKGSIIIHGLEEIPVHSKDDVYRLLEAGKERRRTASTLINAQSSRSHTVFSILVHIRENNDDGEEMLKIGKLNLVDLAGSENISKAGNERGIRTRETVNINQSLLTLGRVITALVERTPHVPYRESKLTRLLQESLGGRTKTSIIATISPGHKDIEETLSTLDYAHRARNIQNKPEVNQKLTKKTVLKEYTEEIDRLKRELTSAREKNGVYLPVERYEEISAQMESQNRELNEKMLHIKALKEEIVKKDAVFNEVSSKLLIETNALQNTRQDLLNAKTNLKNTKKALVSTKRRFEEHKVVIENQAKVEAELTSQAQQILEVTELATKDVEGLHKSIDRRKVVDKNIQSSVGEYTGKIFERYDLMNNSLKNLRDQHHKVAEEIRQHLVYSTGVANNLLQDGIRQVRDISKRNDEGTSALINCSNKFRGLFDSLDVSHKSIANDILESWNQLEIQRNEYLNTHLGELEKVNVNMKLLMETICSSTRNILLDNLRKTDNFIKNLQAQYNSLHEANEINSNAIARLQGQIDAHKLKEQERQTMIDKFLVQMKNISCENSANTESMEQTRMELETGHLSINETLKQNSVELDQFASINRADCTNHIEEADAHLELTIHHSKEHTLLCSTMQDQLDKYYKQYLVNNQCLNDEHSKHYVAEKDLWQNYEKDLSALSKEKVHATNEALKGFESLVANKVNILNEEMEATSNLILQIDKNIGSYGRSHEDNLNRCIEDASDLKERKIKSYVSSGDTPAKRNYCFPNELVKCSPHEKIIQRFREKMNWTEQDYADFTNIELNELNESYGSETSSPDKILNSTPLNNPIRNNIENMTVSMHSEDPLREIQKNNFSNDNSQGSPLFMKRFRFQTSNKENIQGD